MNWLKLLFSQINLFTMEIEKEIQIKTTQCENDFSCLKNGITTCCKVLSCINNKVLFVDCTSKVYCAYKITFGYSDICNCPTRIEIYNKYAL